MSLRSIPLIVLAFILYNVVVLLFGIDALDRLQMRLRAHADDMLAAYPKIASLIDALRGVDDPSVSDANNAHLARDLSQFGDVTWHGDFGVFAAFVFEHDIATIFHCPQNANQLGQVSRFGFAACTPDFRFDLGVDGKWCELLQISVWIGGMKVSGIPIHAKGVIGNA